MNFNYKLRQNLTIRLIIKYIFIKYDYFKYIDIKYQTVKYVDYNSDIVITSIFPNINK